MEKVEGVGGGGWCNKLDLPGVIYREVVYNRAFVINPQVVVFPNKIM